MQTAHPSAHQPVDPPALVVLTGFMGTGKTTVGRLLAARLGYAFVDTDVLIEQRHGSIVEVFEQRGEEAFRSLERDVAAELAGHTETVVATGGALMLDQHCADSLRLSRIFCLVASSEEILGRVARGSGVVDRPLLRGSDPAAAIRDLLAQRAKGYGQFEQVPTGGRTPDQIADDLLERLGASAG